jgi:two-component system phosphate regulon response regulator PhoB
MTVRKTVVVADDEPVVRHLVHATLALGAPVEVLEARTGAEALALVRRRPIDLLLLDVGMPELDGLETCRALKADPATRHIPVVFLSARAQPADRDAGAAAGASGYLTKPFSPRVLSETARRLLGP